MMDVTKKSVVIFLCTPRCGTQWFAHNLRELYEDETVVTFEPILYDYYPRKNLWSVEADLQPKENKSLENHLNYIEEKSKRRIYIEIGWQSIAGISKLYERFSEHLKIVHLYRNPINVAASMVTHDWYTKLSVERSNKAELLPSDSAAMLKSYGAIWDELNLYEKCLYYWTEVNMCALSIQNRYSDLPFYSLKFENIFKKNIEINRIYFNELVGFLGLKYKEELIERLDITLDNYKYKTYKSINWKDVYAHPQTTELANKLGYGLDEKINMSRYEVSIMEKLKASILRNLKQLYGLMNKPK